MPVYLVTDALTQQHVMVDAHRPAGAIAAIVANRFGVSDGLTASEAMRLANRGVTYLDATVEVAPQEPEHDVAREACAGDDSGALGDHLDAVETVEV